MLKWASLLGILCTTCAFSGGCATTAGDIASGYHTLGTGWFSKAEEKRLVAMIESGEADRMVAEGKSKKNVYRRGCGNGEVLVTEHEILGMVYRVEVRNRINPVDDILTTNVRMVTYGKIDRALQTIHPVERADVLRTLANSSFDAQGQVAFRSYIGSDGSLHPVRVMSGDAPDWSDLNAIDLVIRTDVWPDPVLHFRGLRPPGKDRNGRLLEPDGRWIVMSEGTGVTPTKTFINHDLHKTMKLIAFGQAYNTDILNLP